MEARQRIGRLLKAELIKRGIRQRDIAGRLNIDYRTLNRQLNGYAHPDFFVLVGVADELGLNANELYRRAIDSNDERGTTTRS